MLRFTVLLFKPFHDFSFLIRGHIVQLQVMHRQTTTLLLTLLSTLLTNGHLNLIQLVSYDIAKG